MKNTGRLLAKAKEEGMFEPVSLHPYIDLSTCIGSAACVADCPEKDILGIVDGKATVILASNCVGHGACFHACPVQAIPRGDRSLELTSVSNRPGIRRWHVNVAKCLQFWVANGGSPAGLHDCANCIAACPWGMVSRPWL